MRPIVLRKFHILQHTLSNRELLIEKAFLISGAQALANSVAAQVLTSDTGQWHNTACWFSLRKIKSNSFKWRCGWSTALCRNPISLKFIFLEGFPLITCSSLVKEEISPEECRFSRGVSFLPPNPGREQILHCSRDTRLRALLCRKRPSLSSSKGKSQRFAQATCKINMTLNCQHHCY